MELDKTKFRYLQDVTVKTGYYKGYKGRIESYIITVLDDEKKVFIYQVKLENVKDKQNIPEHELRCYKKWVLF